MAFCCCCPTLMIPRVLRTHVYFVGFFFFGVGLLQSHLEH